MTILWLAEVGQFSKIVRLMKGADPQHCSFLGFLPHLFRFRTGKLRQAHRLSLGKLPFRSDGDPKNWDTEVKRHGDDLLDFWREYAPNLDRNTILDQFTLSSRRY